MTMKRCSGAACPRIVPTGKCADCRRAQNQVRGSRQARGYDADWQRVRLAILERDGWVCQIAGVSCLGAADAVDHVDPGATGPRRLDPTNLRAACRPCNSAKGNR